MKKVHYHAAIHSYDSEEIAEHGFKNLKSNGCIKPLLPKNAKKVKDSLAFPPL